MTDIVDRLLKEAPHREAEAKTEIERLRALLRKAAPIVSDRAAGGRMVTPQAHAAAVRDEIAAALDLR